MWQITEGSRLSIGGVGTPATSEDPQPALDLVEEGVEWPEEKGIWERGHSRNGGCIERHCWWFSMRMEKGRWRGGAFYMMKGQTWHVSSPIQGPRNLLQPNIPSIESGRSRRPEVCSVG